MAVAIGKTTIRANSIAVAIVKVFVCARDGGNVVLAFRESSSKEHIIDVEIGAVLCSIMYVIYK